MSSVSKAIDLVNWFGAERAQAERAQIVLAEFQRLTGRDKTTTYRHLCALEETGLLEKDSQTRTYCISPAARRLAYIREATMPRQAGARLVLAKPAEATKAVAHTSILQGNALMPPSDHTSSLNSARVFINETVLSLHATGSGLATMAFGDPTLRTTTLSSLKRHTQKTKTSNDEPDTALNEVSQPGFGIVNPGVADILTEISKDPEAGTA